MKGAMISRDKQVQPNRRFSMLAVIPIYIVAGTLGFFATLGSTRGLKAGVGLLLATKLMTRDYQKGEGPLSQMYNDSGLLIHPQGDPLGQFICYLGRHFPEISSFQGQRYALTISEGEQLRLSIAALSQNPFFSELLKADQGQSEVPLETLIESLTPAVLPILNFFERYEGRMRAA